MAKRRTSPRKTSRKSASENLSVEGVSGDKVLKSWKDLYDSPAVKYVAAGIATAALSKLIKTISKRYPELTKILNEGLESVEDRLVDFNKVKEGGTKLQH